MSQDRANYVGAPAMFHLQNACLFINEALDDKRPSVKTFGRGGSCYLVGSCLTKRDFRDVDVRFIMGDEQFTEMFGSVEEGHAWMHARWSLINTALADYLRRLTGLPIDFQIQSQTYANEKFSPKAGHARHALGWFLTNDPKESPLPSAPDGQRQYETANG